MTQPHRRKGGGNGGPQQQQQQQQQQQAVKKASATEETKADDTNERVDDGNLNSKNDDSTTLQNNDNNNMMVWAVLAAVVSALFWLLISPPPIEQIQQDLTSIRDEIKDTLSENQMIQTLQSKINILEKELRQKLNESLPAAYLSEEPTRPGYRFKQRGAKAKYPVVMVPGFVTTGLEVWGGAECAKKHFRQRLWAAMGMVQQVLTERDCWIEHMKLDPLTGMDPGNIRIRSASGFEAADYFMANYWVFGKLIENLADVGYDPSNMSMMPYDWRLAFPLLEERDGYFSRVRNEIELMKKINGEKVVLTSHSMGALVCHFFFAWASHSEEEGGCGNRCGPTWIDDHIHSYINIAGPHLGVPKAATALLSGEMQETAMLGSYGELLESFFSRRLRTEILSTWGSLFTMLPMGGEAIWGVAADMCNETSRDNNDDPLCPSGAISPIIARSDSENKDNIAESEEGDKDGGSEDNDVGSSSPLATMLKDFVQQPYHKVQDTIDFLQSYGDGYGMSLSASKVYDFNADSKPSKKTWHDPSRTPLPAASNMRIYCLYGFGLETERAYYYKENVGANYSEAPPIVLDSSIQDDGRDIISGVRKVDGDHSVPLVSLGYICSDAWQRENSGLNPSKVPVTTREYKHEEVFVWDDPGRGGPDSGEHCDTLGNVRVVQDFLHIATDFEADEVKKPQIESEIESIAARLNAHPNGGIFKNKRRNSG